MLLRFVAAVVIPVTTGTMGDRVFSTTVQVTNASSHEVRCAFTYGELLVEATMPAAATHVHEDFLGGGSAATVRVDCSGEVEIVARVQDSVDGGRTFREGRVYRPIAVADVLARGDTRALRAEVDLVLAEIAGHAVRVDVAAGAARRTYDLSAFAHRVVNLTAAADVTITVAGGAGKIVIGRESREPALASVALRRDTAQLATFKAAPFCEPLTGHCFVRNRWYDPHTGTFLTPDPERYRDSASLYSYCGGDPVNCSDPDGSRARPAPRALQPLGANAPRYAPGDWLATREAVESSRVSRPPGAGARVFSGRTADELTPAEQVEFLAHRRRLRTDTTYRSRWEALLNAPPPILPKLPGVTPYGQQAQALSPGDPQIAIAYHNDAVRTAPPRPAGSPHYSVYFRVTIDPSLYPTRSEHAHFQDANQQLHEYMQQHPDFAAALERDYPGITAFLSPGARGAYPRKTPAELGLTWHHAREPGVLELIPKQQHESPGPVQQSLHPNQQGGMETWGGGRKRPGKQ